MPRPRDRFSAFGLLPRMEARPRKDGKITYRYRPVDANPVNLGSDKTEAIRKVLDMLGTSQDVGTVKELWRTYQTLPQWHRLADLTKRHYTIYSGPLLRVMGGVHASAIRPADVARYLRVERGDAPVRANREIALLSNLMQVAIERGDIGANPCKQVKRNKESPRTEAPEPETLAAFLPWLTAQTRQRHVIALMAEFAALAGSRRVEFLNLTLMQIDSTKIRLMRAKQHDGRRKVETVEITEAMADLVGRMKALPRPSGCLHVFTTRDGNPYTEAAFTTLWQRVMVKALKEGVIGRRFTFHDLRAYYTTQHKERYGDLPDIHASKATTSRVYDRSKVAARKGL